MDIVMEEYAFPGVRGVRCVFFGRGLNISFKTGERSAKVLQNRRDLRSCCEARNMEFWCECSQVHGNSVIQAEPTPLDPRVLREADGSITARPRLGLMIKTADCQPLLFADTSGKHIMAIHVGWRGNRMNFPAHAVKHFCQTCNIEPRDVWAVRGPSLGPDKAEFVNFASEWGEEFLPWYNPKTRCMNLWQLTADQLHKAGVPRKQIDGLPICTYQENDRWFSYRRSKNDGRQAAFIWIEH